jgi:hypothetical protein
MKHILLLLFVIQLSNISISQTDSEQRALWIFNIAYGTNWENESDIDTFSIGVFSSEKEYQELFDLSKIRRIKGKPVTVFLYNELDNIKEHDILYVTKEENKHLHSLHNNFKAKNILLISDRSKEREYSMINFNRLSETKKFDLNLQLGENHGFRFSGNVKKLGGERELIKEIYSDQQKELQQLKVYVDELKSESEMKDKRIQDLEIENQKLKDRIKKLEDN